MVYITEDRKRNNGNPHTEKERESICIKYAEFHQRLGKEKDGNQRDYH